MSLTALPLFIVNPVVEPSPVAVPLVYVNVGDRLDFWIFFIAVAEVSYTNNKSPSAACSDNSVWPEISKVFVKFVFVIFLKAEAESS